MKVKILLKTENPTVIEEICTFNDLTDQQIDTLKNFTEENPSMTMMTLDRYAKLARVRALILQVINREPGLTYEQIGKRILQRYGFLPRIGNRVRELRELGYVKTVEETDGRLHVYPQ